MSHIFISYVEEDSSLVLEVTESLEASGYKTWYYERDSAPGLSYLEQMGKAIDDAQAMVLVISPQSVTSRQVTTEVVRAHEQAKPFIPLLHGMSHAEFQERQSSWRQVLGASTSITVSHDASQAASRIAVGLKALGIEPELAPPLSSTSGVFVGREREMAELTRALDDALSGSGRLVLLVGEPGIGKTRMARELAYVAQQQGALALWGRCYEEEGTPPFWPWVQAIRAYVRSHDADTLRSTMGLGAADIAEIVPDVRAKLPDLEPPPALDSPEQARFRLFDSVVTFLKNASSAGGLMLVFDDLHWADKPSLLLLQHLARELGDGRVFVVGAYRDMELNRQHPLSETLAELSREPVFHRVLLRGLTQQEIERFIQEAADVQPSQGLVEAIFVNTQGNPLFMGEVVELLSDEGQLTAADMGGAQGHKIPEGVREVIGQRLNRLSEQCSRALTIASVIGREFEFRLLHVLSDPTRSSGQALSEDQLLEVIDEALAARVLEEVAGGAERYQFSHALIQQTLQGELSTSRRVRLHARIGEALEELSKSDLESRSAELAYHFAEAAPVLGGGKLIRYSLLAGERALAAYAWEDAQAHFERAMAAKDPSTADQREQAELQSPDAERAAILFGIGRTQLAMLQQSDAADSLGRAFTYYAELGDRSAATAVAESLPPGSRLLGMTQLTARALEMVPSDSPQEGRLLSRHGLDLGRVEGDYEGAQAAFARALSIAHRESDILLEFRTLTNAADVDGWHLHNEGALEKSLKAVELATHVDDRYTETLARFWVGTALLRIGDPKAAEPHCVAGLVAAETVRDRFRLRNALLTNQALAALQGHWDTARDYSDRGLAAWVWRTNLGARAVLEFQVGETDSGSLHLASCLEGDSSGAGPGGADAIVSRTLGRVALITGATDQLDSAEAIAEAALSAPSIIPRTALMAKESLGLIAVLRGDATSARRQYIGLSPLQHSMPGVAPDTSGDRILGLLAHTMGTLDDAQAHFEDALAFCRKAGYKPELAWSLCDYGELLIERNGPTDPYMANALLDESLSISTELGMKPLKDRVQLRLQHTDR